MRKLFLLAIFIACSAPLTYAQDDYNKYDIYAGYSHNRVDVGRDDDDPDIDDVFDEREGFNGFEVSVKGTVSRYVGLKGDYSFHRKKFGSHSFDFVEANLHNFLGGVEFKDNAKETRVKPFAHILAGGAHATADVDPILCAQAIGVPCPTDIDDSETGFAAAIGGGLDFRINDRVDFRAVQFDYNPTRLGGQTQHNFRIGIGIVFR